LNICALGEFFEYTEEDVIRFVYRNKRRIIPADEKTSVVREQLINRIKEYKQANPEGYKRLLMDVRRQLSEYSSL
jgi:hypothetical protein